MGIEGLTKENIDSLIASFRAENFSVEKRDIVFAILRNIVGVEVAGYLTSRDVTKLEKYAYSRKSSLLVKKLDELGIRPTNGVVPTDNTVVPAEENDEAESLTKEQNKAELIKMLQRVRKMTELGMLEAKDGLKMETDIRVRLQDKFEMERSEDERRIIVVPQKHDIICPHTNRECTFMPTKEACIEYYKIKEVKKK